MEIKFTNHAQYRYHTRTFSIEQMKQTILYPDFTRYDNNGKIVSEKRFGNSIVRVVYSRYKKLFIIISVYNL